MPKTRTMGPPGPDNGGMDMRWKPSVTVAAVIERQGRYLLIEEHTPEGLRLNNPAGHLDPDESLVQACEREALEETTHTFRAEALVGIYLSRFQRPARGEQAAEDITYLRFAFCGTLGEAIAGRHLDTGIVRTLWMSPDEVQASAAQHRSPLVLRCVLDHQAGVRLPLTGLHTDASVQTLHAAPRG
jgi:8-oxo-dGTP pyrophosphatase MutT (NUDIX family)